MDKAELTKQLDACLVDAENPEAFALGKWRELPDPFPEWRRAA
jgi:hypothetical protein